MVTIAVYDKTKNTTVSIMSGSDYSGLDISNTNLDFFELTSNQSTGDITSINTIYAGTTNASRLITLKNIMKDKVGVQRLIKETSGFSFTFQDGVGSVQTRDSTDIRNINGMVTMAMIANSQGVTGNAFSFRDTANITHPMTPSEVINLGVSTNTFISNTYQTSWIKKSEIDALTTETAVRGYSYSTGW